MRIECFLCFEGETVNTCKHGVFFVATPVGTCYFFKLEGVCRNFLSRVLAVAAATKVGKTAAGVEGNCFAARGYFFNEFEFVLVACKNGSCLFKRNFLMRKFFPLWQKVAHHGFNAREVCITWRLVSRRKINVIVEAVFYCWSKGDFRLRILFKNGCSKQVCQRVTNMFEIHAKKN